MRGQGPRARRCVQFFVVCCFKTVCPSGQGDGLEIHWALPAGVRIPAVSYLEAATVWPSGLRSRWRFGMLGEENARWRRK